MAKPARKIWKSVVKDKYTDSPSPVMEAVDKLVEFVKPTLGPKIRHVLVDFGYKTELMDDGVSIAEEFELENEFEDAVASYVREASKRTDDKAGDGTTTTMVILQSLLKAINASGKSYPEVRAELEKAKLEAMGAIEATPVDSLDTLLKVARTSMNDEEAAKVVADVVWQTGAKGAVSISDHPGRGVESERMDGFVMGRGVIHRGFINDQDNQCFSAPNPNFPGPVAVAVVESLISTESDIVPILRAADSKGIKNLVIFCTNLIGEALGVVALNRVRGAFNISAVQLPGQGEKMKDYVTDICAVTGASTPVGEFTAVNLGTADSVKSTVDDTTLVGGHGEQGLIESIIADVDRKCEETKDEYEKEYYHLRQARLRGGVVMIRVGGVTETETRLRLKKVEDAVNACKCAMEDGVCPGAGITLFRVVTSSAMLNEALRSVHETVLANAEAEYRELPEGETLNVLTGESGPFLQVGVADAVKVLKTAVENAVSIATILFSTSGIITSKRDDNQKS